MQVRYIGDGTDAKDRFGGPQVLETSGFRFVKNEWLEVPDDHPRADKFKGNHTFEVKGDKRPQAQLDENDQAREEGELREELEARGVEAPAPKRGRPGAQAASLRRLLAKEAEPGPTDEEPPAPPVPAS